VSFVRTPDWLHSTDHGLEMIPPLHDLSVAVTASAEIHRKASQSRLALTSSNNWSFFSSVVPAEVASRRISASASGS